MGFFYEGGMIAGIAGLALGVFRYLFAIIIKKEIFPQLTKKQSYKTLNRFMVLVFIISITTILLSYRHNKSEMQLTVFITDSNGNVVLENEGRLNIVLGNRSLNESIGANGRTNFPDITPNNKGDTFDIGLDAEGWELANGNNTFIFTGEPIHLCVKRDNTLGTLKGIVKSRDGQQFIEGAMVCINTDTTILTNSLGIFRVILPESMAVKNETERYLLTVSKNGYKTKTLYYSPKSSDAEIRLDKW